EQGSAHSRPQRTQARTHPLTVSGGNGSGEHVDVTGFPADDLADQGGGQAAGLEVGEEGPGAGGRGGQEEAAGGLGVVKQDGHVFGGGGGGGCGGADGGGVGARVRRGA